MRAAHDTEARPVPGIAYSVRSGTSPEMERAALANIYSFVLRCGNKNAPAKRKADGSNASDNDEREEGVGMT
jgi:hypothetical protein